MLTSVSRRGEFSPDGTHVGRLNALWKLSARRDLSDAQRIRAMLAMASGMLDMDLAALGEFGEHYVARYVHDPIGVFAGGTTPPVDEALCREVLRTRSAVFLPDLNLHPEYRDTPAVARQGVNACFALPVGMDGESRWVLVFLRRSKGAADPADIATMELIADWLGNVLHQSAQTALLQHMALTDPLTGLPNRRAAEERLQNERANAARDGSGFALALVDLDHFKSINDCYGHAVGDEVLRAATRRFERDLRARDWVARWGGEEFLFVLHADSLEEAGHIVERLAERMRDNPVQTSVGGIALSFSAGVAVFAVEGDETAAQLEEIDQALYLAKTGGRDQVRRVAPSPARMNGLRLREALAADRVRHASQPIVDLASGVAIADEALARIVAPEGGVVDACHFVELAEGLGLMAEIDRQVIRTVMQSCVTRMASGGAPDFAHFVNVSPQFLARRDLVEEMLANAVNYCQSCGVSLGPVKPIVLELTERQRIVSLDKLRADLQPFIDFGFRLALDDFGSGYSSYLYLANLPVSFLKIEGWLISHMRDDRKVAGIVESLASFARKEGVRTVAEHVEDAQTARLLADMGIDYAQGWHFGRPELV